MSTHAQIRLEAELSSAPVLLVEVRYGRRMLCARLLSARSSRTFTVGGGRRADAPVDPRYLSPVHAGRAAANDNHTLVEPRGAGFAIHLSPAMRERAERSANGLRIPCGDVVFDITAASPAARVPRPWLRAGWGGDARVTAGVALGLLLLLALMRAVPSDPRALSLEDVGRDLRAGEVRIIPRVVIEPPAPRGGSLGGGAPTASAGPSGMRGDRAARPADARRATKGSVRHDTVVAARAVHDGTMLAILDGTRGAAFASVLADRPALGDDARDVLAHLDGTIIGVAYGAGGLGTTGTGEGGADTGHPLLGGAPGLGTYGRFGDHDGPRRGYGADRGALQPRKPHPIDLALRPGTVEGSLDKEIVRRVVRQHLNEVRFCYEQGLVARPTLAGRVVAAFTIAGNGRVLAAALQSSSLGAPAVEACVVAATRRWLFPQPAGGGLVTVTYPFQLAPAGG